MSYAIEYESHIYRIPRETDRSFDEDDFLWVITQGDNNVYDVGFNGRQRRARDDYIISYGWNYSIIGEVCRRAGVCEGGSLKPKGRDMSPENYLRKYRRKIANAEPIENFFNKGKKARILLNLNSDYRKEEAEKLKEYISEEANYYHPEVIDKYAEISITDLASLKTFLQLWGLAADTRYAELI